MATIRDVAKAAGMSIGSVSRYLNGYALKEENMTKIKKAIEKLDFKQNYLAKGLKTKKSHAIGVVVNALTDVFAASIVTPLEYYLEKNNYELIMCDYQNDISNLKQKLQFLSSRNVDGVVIFHLSKPISYLYELQKQQIPIVAVDVPIAGFPCDAILTDNHHASENVVKNLYRAGHRQIGIIAGNSHDYVASQRLQGYVATMKKLGIYQPDLIAMGNYFQTSGYKATKKLLQSNRKITALYTTNYYLTLGAIHAINDLNLKIPQELAFVGFDDYDLSKVINPPLTVVAQPVKQMGEKTGEIILKRIKSPNLTSFKPHILNTKLIWRQSAGQKSFL